MTVFAIDPTTFAVTAHADASGSIPNGAYVFHDAESLTARTELTAPVLAKVYNNLASTPVNRFADRASAVKRTFALIEQLPVSDTFEAPEEEIQQQAVRPSVQEAATDVAPEAPAKPKAPKAPKAEGTKAGRQGNRDKHLYLNVKANPMRAGSWSHSTIEMIVKQPGIKYSELMENGGRANTVNFALRGGIIVAEDELRG